MIPSIFVILTMLGVCVVAPIAVPTIVTTAVKKARAYGNAIKAEKRVREAANQEEKNPKLEKKLLKQYYKTKEKSANRVLPSNENLNKDNFYSNKLTKNEAKRNKLEAQINLAKVNNNLPKVEKLSNKLQNKYDAVQHPSTQYSFVETLAIAGQQVQMPSNSIYCNVKSANEMFKQAVESKDSDFTEKKTYPIVAEFKSDNEVISHVSSVNFTKKSEPLTMQVLPEIAADAYVDALTKEQSGQPVNYEFSIFNADPKENKQRTYQSGLFTDANGIMDYFVGKMNLVSKDDFLNKARQIAKEKNLEVAIDGVKIKQIKPKEKQKESAPKTQSFGEERIECESKITKNNFEKSLTNEKFAPNKSQKGFETVINIGPNVKYSLKTDSKTRETTFTVDLLAEAYRKSLINEKNNAFEPITYTVNWKEKEKGSKTFDEMSKEVTFNSPKQIYDYVIDNYAQVKDYFDSKIQSLNNELENTNIKQVDQSTESISTQSKLVKERYSNYLTDKYTTLEKPVSIELTQDDNLIGKITSARALEGKSLLSYTVMTDMLAEVYVDASVKEKLNQKINYEYFICEIDPITNERSEGERNTMQSKEDILWVATRMGADKNEFIKKVNMITKEKGISLEDNKTQEKTEKENGLSM